MIPLANFGTTRVVCSSLFLKVCLTCVVTPNSCRTVFPVPDRITQVHPDHFAHVHNHENF